MVTSSFIPSGVFCVSPKLRQGMFLSSMIFRNDLCNRLSKILPEIQIIKITKKILRFWTERSWQTV